MDPETSQVVAETETTPEAPVDALEEAGKILAEGISTDDPEEKPSEEEKPPPPEGVSTETEEKPAEADERTRSVSSLRAEFKRRLRAADRREKEIDARDRARDAALSEREKALVAQQAEIAKLHSLSSDPLELIKAVSAKSGVSTSDLMRGLAQESVSDPKTSILAHELQDIRRELQKEREERQREKEEAVKYTARSRLESAVEADVENIATGRGEHGRGSMDSLSEHYPHFAALPDAERRQQSREAIEWCVANGRDDVSLDMIASALDRQAKERYVHMRQRLDTARGNGAHESKAPPGHGNPVVKPGANGNSRTVSNQHVANATGTRRVLSESEALEEAGRVLAAGLSSND